MGLRQGMLIRYLRVPSWLVNNNEQMVMMKVVYVLQCKRMYGRLYIYELVLNFIFHFISFTTRVGSGGVDIGLSEYACSPSHSTQYHYRCY